MAALLPYHKRLVEILSTPPGKGQGHYWLLRAALHLRHYHKAEVVTDFLREYTSTWDRQVPDEEIAKTVARAYSLEPSGAPGSTEDWPEPCPAAIAAVLQNTEPLPLDPDLGISASDCLRGLWPAEALICCGASQSGAKVRTCQEWLEAGPDALQFIVPSRMRAPWGVTHDGRESRRCLANTGPREHLVVECDAATQDEQARILARLATILPLRLVVHSGGKSLHGWFRVDGLYEPLLAKVFRWAVRLGADAHTWTRCQWVRMPGGTRTHEDGTTSRQPILYWNP